MVDRRTRSWARNLFLCWFVVAAFAGSVRAHEVGGSRFETPLPLSLLLAGAGGTVALTALWLALTDRTPDQIERRQSVLTVSPRLVRPIRVGFGGIFLAGVVTALLTGLLGQQIPAENFATVFTWPVWFRGLALLALLVGTPWRTLSPWRLAYRGLVKLEGRDIAVLGTYPSRLAEWPAVVGFVALLGIIENLTVIPQSPRMTTVIVAVYGLVMIGGATLYGPDWLGSADPLGVFYRLFGRVAPIDITSDDGQYTVTVRPPWQGCLDPVGTFSIVVFVVATVYTVSFDGFTNIQLFQTVLFETRDFLGLGPETSVFLYLVGLFGFVAVFSGVLWLVERLGTGPAPDWVTAARWFAPTVLPIAAAYEVAHNYPYVIRNLGTLVDISLRWAWPSAGPFDPLWWLSLPVFWGSQVLLIVLGHVVAVVAAHYVATERYDTASAALRAHLPLVVLMIGYTVLSLWIVSQPVVSG